ncbi:MAG: hypothetical protein K2X87_22665 [Gemmataceae bacterium]|nr:hypothetical protein [Gemmataceae bacterium]
MSLTLTLELSPAAAANLERLAAATGRTVAELAAVVVESRYGRPPDPRTEAEKQAARERFERHFGAVDLGRPTGADNEGIDADLAREYGDRHEG